MQILEVLIEYGLSSLDRTFSYFYEGEKKLLPGIRVLVNFNHKDIVGYVLNVKEYQKSIEEYQKESIYVIKPIKEVIDEVPLLNDELQKLAKDITDYYLKGQFGSIPTPDLFASLEEVVSDEWFS